MITEEIESLPRKANFHVHPRYTCGSGAMVDMMTCMHVAAQEKESYQHILEGAEGEERQALAQEVGLEGICYARWEKGRRVFRYDLLTGRTFQEPKRLEYEELERWKVLESHVRILARFGSRVPGEVGMNDKDKRELEALRERAKIHRQEIKP